MASKDKLEEDIADLREELEQLIQERQQDLTERADSTGVINQKQKGINRRQFLKHAGTLGMVGLGVTLFEKTAAAYQIRSSNPFTVADQAGNTKLEVGTNGTLNLQGNDITNAGSVSTEELDSTQKLTPPSVPTANDLPSDSVSAEADVVWVEDEQRWYTYMEE